ncbi:bifunctional glycosyltransferase/CDP-glycerol:glycerophosphate glycerophosphotransferase [Microbacterium invictum]|uniref:Glycosyltransferase involved in cell wall biosynthesis n=1 Tax=Microbacterium invictum TaxID=515415 RepID=A0AA40SNZ5_9MICO|nr:CDP-glycerol glycerophosphotransferase family protein [Microbacterium invictum]MBB4139753.1 glycosyltransferase involved in cell wall biosynthesis [Microbacterium invictum]
MVAMYGVEEYLPSFLASLEAQGAALSDVEVVFVDDGSPDDAARIVDAWITGVSVRAYLISQRNGGVASARNAGMEVAQGKWLTFADPDDILDTGYLSEVVAALGEINDGEEGAPALLSTNLVFTDDTLALRRDAHPLRNHFARGRRVVNLIDEPQMIKLSAATSFIRRDELIRRQVSWDPRVRPNFEDGAFLARYLLGFSQPRMLVLPEARYLYRKRTEATSLTTTSWQQPEKYTDVPRYGWLEPLREAVSLYGAAPAWLQNTVLYDLYWYLHYDTQIHSPTRAIAPGVRDEFLAVVREVLAIIDPETITAYGITRVSPQLQAVLLALGGHELSLSPIHVWRADSGSGLVLVKYYFAGEPPIEHFTVGGMLIAPAHEKYRSVVYFGQVVLHERICWIQPHEPMGLRINGQLVELRYKPPGTHQLSMTAEGLRRNLGMTSRSTSSRDAGSPGAGQVSTVSSTDVPVAPSGPKTRRSASLRDTLGQQVKKRRTQLDRVLTGRSVVAKKPWAALARRAAKTDLVRRRFDEAWVFMDRDVQAQDNAEHLYRWVLRNRPDVNAWFVLRRTSTDWERLREDGFRLVDYGSTEHFLLLENARYLVSSHVDQYVLAPWSAKLSGPRRWMFVFLQHGVTKDDVSRWINPKPLRLIVATGLAEYRAFTANGTPYTLTSREVALTGFPRHDALLRKANEVQVHERQLVLIMPTWREYLMGPVSGRGTTRDLIEGFDESSYAIQWKRLLVELVDNAALADTNSRVGFVPHPNLEPHLERLDIPNGVEVFRYRDHDIQDVITRARVLVTDYSSLAFEAAYIHTPVVYFQFDVAQFFEEHPHREGYFEYERDGFGPVARSADEAVAAIQDAIASGKGLAVYERRAEEFFIERDGKNCERAFAAINSLK